MISQDLTDFYISIPVYDASYYQWLSDPRSNLEPFLRISTWGPLSIKKKKDMDLILTVLICITLKAKDRAADS